MSDERSALLAEHTARLLDDVNLRVEGYDAVDEDTAFLGYVGHADDAEAVLRETARPVVAAFTAALDEESWPAVEGLVVRAFDPTTPAHRREGALEWEVSRDVAKRYAAATDAEAADDDEDGEDESDTETESSASVVADAMATARIVYADGRVEPLSLGE